MAFGALETHVQLYTTNKREVQDRHTTPGVQEVKMEK
jgi:hypothetical protein